MSEANAKYKSLHTPLKLNDPSCFSPLQEMFAAKALTPAMIWKPKSLKALSVTGATSGFAYPSPLPGSQGLESVTQGKVWSYTPTNSIAQRA